nr:hypothetical protein [Tanacetum cinerariifolium]
MSQTERQKEKVAENASNKRKWEGNHNGSSNQQNKGHKVPRAHTAWPINKKAYAGSLPLCNLCKFHHNVTCTVKCRNYKKDIYAAGFESRPPMLNKENYLPWSSRLLRYAKSRPNRKLIHNSIFNGPYVRRIIPEPGDAEPDVNVNETFHEQTDDGLFEKQLKQIEADDQAIQTILLGLPEDIYAAVDSCETAQEIWLRVQQMMKGSDIGIQEKKAKLFNEWERFTSNEGESIESYYHRFLKLMNDLKRNKHFPKKIASNMKFLNNLQPEWSRHVTIVHQTKDLHTADYTQLYDFLKYNQKENYMQQPMPKPDDITDSTTVINMALALMAKAFKLNYSTPTNNNQRISSNPRNRQIAQPGMNMGQDRQMQMIGVQNVRNQVAQNLRVQNVGNQNQIGNGNLVAVRAEGNAAGHNGNQIRYGSAEVIQICLWEVTGILAGDHEGMFAATAGRIPLYPVSKSHI